MRTKWASDEQLAPIANMSRKDLIHLTKYAVNQSVIASRARLFESLGKSFDGKRDLYAAMGWKKQLFYSDFEARFVRQGIAKRIIRAAPDSTWRSPPTISENDDSDQTKFETEIASLVKQTRAFHYLHRVDVVSGIGRYGALFMGFDDGKLLEEPVEGAKTLMYMQPYSEDNASVASLQQDPTNPRFGLPQMYNVRMRTTIEHRSRIISPSADTSTGSTRPVHWSRMIHVAELLTESDIFAAPRIECVYNDLQNLELVSAGAAEMFWKGAFPGISFEADPTAKLEDKAAVEEQIENYFHGLSRYLRLKGIKANQLESQVADPSPIVDTSLKLISGGTGIPVRILTGSEMGELASSQDENNWNSRIGERRENFATPVMVRGFTDLMIDNGIVTAPAGGEYDVDWPDIDALSEKDKAEIAVKKSEAIAKYVQSGSDVLLGPEQFLVRIMAFDADEAKAIVDEIRDMIDTEVSQMREDAVVMQAEIEAERQRQLEQE